MVHRDLRMTLNLDTLPRKAAVALLALAATLGLSLPLWSHFQVARLSAHGTRESLEQAISLQPRNAELHNRLGRLLLYSPLGDPARTAAELQRAVELDPRSGAFWMDLAIARELNGDTEGAAAAISRARAAEPHTPALLWHEANFEIRRGRLEQALTLLRSLMQNAPAYTGRALPLFSRVTEPATLVSQVVPATRPAMSAALEFLRRENHVAAAAAAWDRVLKMSDPPVEQVRPFINWLINRGDAEMARRAWLSASERGWIPIPPEAAAQPLYNADFSLPVEDFGFDWLILPHPEASVWLEGRGPEPGLNSLCVQFSEDARADYYHVVHYIPVQPNYHYSLQAAVRTGRLTSHTGAYLQIRDSFHNSAPARTEGVTGTGLWREVFVSFETGPEARLLELRLHRPAPAAAEGAGSGLVCMARLQWSELGPARTEIAGKK
jgi:hypothetical protein